MLSLNFFLNVMLAKKIRFRVDGSTNSGNLEAELVLVFFCMKM